MAKRPDLAKRLPRLDGGELAIKTICGDLIASMPAHLRPTKEELTPPGLLTLFAKEKSDEKERRSEFDGKNQMEVANAKARLKWMDQQRIDYQNVICVSSVGYMQFSDDVGFRQEICRAGNDWLADTCIEGDGRLWPVTVLDYTDLDWAVQELARMRKRGSRIVLIPGSPIEGVSPAHPSWDELWKAITDNGMAAMLHTGFERMSYDPGWSNMAADATLLRQFGSSFRHVTPQLLLNAMVYGGTFERNPALTVMVAELGVGWLPFFVNEIDDRISPTAQLFLGGWKHPLKPSEYLKRNVRATPLAGGNDSPLDRIMSDLPEDMLLFSSDFPHFEGFADPQGHYAELFRKIGPAQRERFLSGNTLAIYERMGDPLPMAKVTA
jgi:predicted TIM-barrel fold metal-dependent hydrolase